MTRFQFLAGVDTPGASYGDDTYGGNITYGQSVSDDIGLGPYIATPLLFGGPSPTAWNYRVGDTTPDIQVIVASRADDERINPAAIWTASLVLDRLNTVVPHQITLPMVVTDVFTHNLEAADLDEPGVYRAAVSMVMESERWFNVPFDDRLTMTIYPSKVN